MSKEEEILEWSWHNHFAGSQRLFTSLDTTREEIVEYLKLLNYTEGKYMSLVSRKVLNHSLSRRVTNVKRILKSRKPVETQPEVIYQNDSSRRVIYRSK